MAKAQQILLLVTKILGLVAAGIIVLLGLILGIVSMANGNVAGGIFGIIGDLLLAVIVAAPAIVVFLFGNSMIALDEDAHRNGIVSIIIGVIGGNAPLVVAAIFTLVLYNRKIRD